MKRLIFLLVIFITYCENAFSVVFTELSWNSDGYAVLCSQPFKLKTEEGELKFSIRASYDIAANHWYHFLVLIDKNKIGADQAWYPKGVVLKLRIGNGDVIDLSTIHDYKWEPETKTELEYSTNSTGPGIHVSGVGQHTVFNDLNVLYLVSEEQFEAISEHGIKKIRRERNTETRYDDFNFSDKGTKNSAKTIKSHYSNLVKQKENVYKKLDKFKKKREEKNRKNPPKAVQPVGEF